MTSSLATNAMRRNTLEAPKYLEVNVYNQPLDRQVPRTYQFYHGNGNETIEFDGADQIILQTNLSAGNLTISVNDLIGFRNLIGRIIRVTSTVGIVNDVIVDVDPGTLTATEQNAPSSSYTLSAPANAFDMEIQFYEDMSAFVGLRLGGGEPGSVDLDQLAGGTDGQVIRFIGTTATAVDEILADNVPDLGISEAKLAANSVSTNKLQNLAVTGVKLADNTIFTGKLADNAVTPTKLKEGTDGQVLTTNGTDVVWADPAGSGLPSGALNNVLVHDGTEYVSQAEIDASNIPNNSINTARIQDNAVTPAKIEAGTNNQVLTTNGTDVVWADPTASAPGATSIVSTISDVIGSDGVFPLTTTELNSLGLNLSLSTITGFSTGFYRFDFNMQYSGLNDGERVTMVLRDDLVSVKQIELTQDTEIGTAFGGSFTLQAFVKNPTGISMRTQGVVGTISVKDITFFITKLT